jgi:hypothetical protein
MQTGILVAVTQSIMASDTLFVSLSNPMMNPAVTTMPAP